MTRQEWRDLTNEQLLAMVDDYIHQLHMEARPTISAANRLSTAQVPLKQLVAYLYRSHDLQWSTILTQLGYPAQIRQHHGKIKQQSMQKAQ
ncbi:hypothetical protein [Lacticaseibacillus hulanensis]|uniref:hypothetical protein n=1 Tax=Lacticaseibacillus hulanensis TaxID=2493111 RepID=UPI000FDC9E61|nr:hypothetical protein [Lacticaseibacillus hulanensis]